MLAIALDPTTLITTFDPGSLIYLFDMIGIVTCSISGTILAKHKKFDVFGCLLVSIVTAIGGGTVRDVILNRHPLFWMVDMSYLTVITISSLVMQIFFIPIPNVSINSLDYQIPSGYLLLHSLVSRSLTAWEQMCLSPCCWV